MLCKKPFDIKTSNDWIKPKCPKESSALLHYSELYTSTTALISSDPLSLEHSKLFWECQTNCSLGSTSSN